MVALTDDDLITIAFLDTGIEHRIAADGTYRVGGERRPPTSESEPGAQALSAPALERIRTALDDDGFFALPERVAGGAAPGAVMPGGKGPPKPRPVAIAARDRDGRTHVVHGEGDPRAAWSFGRLAHVYETLDREALGGWLRE